MRKRGVTADEVGGGVMLLDLFKMHLRNYILNFSCHIVLKNQKPCKIWTGNEGKQKSHTDLTNCAISQNVNAMSSLALGWNLVGFVKLLCCRPNVLQWKRAPLVRPRGIMSVSVMITQ